VAEFDPTAWIDDQVEEIESQPCPICGSADKEEILLLCDSCDAPYHTHCVGLDRVPNGNWFCMECESDGAYERAQSTQAAGRQARTSNRRTQRTQAQVRQARQRARTDDWQGAWHVIAGRVWDALNVDLDYDYDDEELNFAPDYRRGQREAQRWQQRMNIAARQGARDVFRDVAQPMIRPREHPIAPQESPEEAQAWGAFEKAKELESGQGSRKRKSRSATASPAEPPKEPERKLKRPRTRRPGAEPAGSSSDASGSSRVRAVTESSRSRPNVDTNGSTNGGTSFLSSLLKEVESSVTPDGELPFLNFRTTAASPSLEHSSPAASPTSSNYPTPRAMSATPPPHITQRPGSPLPLTSHIQPIFPPASYPPSRPAIETAQEDPSSPLAHTTLELRQPRPQKKKHSSINRSEETSPSRATMSSEAKAEVSSLVRKALNPFWRATRITNKQYEDINRIVSRTLYEKISEPDKLDEQSKSAWEKIATAEVAKAVEGLTA
jgi:hypothetical protein